YQKHEFEYQRVVSGLRLMLWGMFKKVVIADNLANVVNTIYTNPDEQNGLTWLIAALFFSFQIYCDFSGYSDIALGSARVMGFKLMQNFNLPYVSSSLREFWSRWHISLSTWFKDYLYIPLGGNKSGKFKKYRNIMIVFLLSGLWHGANWTFIVWGFLHGTYNSLETAICQKLPSWAIKKGSKLLKISLVFSFVTCTWIFFRAENIQEAVRIISTISTESIHNISQYMSGITIFSGLGEYTITHILLLFSLILIFYFTDWLKEKETLQNIFNKKPLFRMTCYFALFYGILFFGFFGKTQFIYFQF
ncbi:MAG TPA: MBOAT family O-acyltransferase, partial [Nitrosopumilaceae archaeon]|nr:MBOAT family O-acyltransferase [Nitrosopumilaceae archaeon]